MALHPGLKRSLRPYRHHALQVAALRGGAAVAAGWGAAFLGAWLRPAGAWWMAALMAAGSVGGLLLAAAHVRRHALHPLGLARGVEAVLPELSDMVRSAVGLARPQAAESRALADAFVAHATERLGHVALRRRHRGLLWRAARPWAVLAAAGTLGVLLPWMAAPERVLGALRSAWTPGKDAAPGRTGLLPPLWSDVTASLTYPAYMKRPPQVLEGLAGDITAPRGTEVTLRARADRAVRAARLVLASGEVPLTVTPPRELAGRFTVMEGGRYRLALTDTSGEEVVEEEGHALNVEPDAPPTVELLAPDGDRVMRQDETLQLDWRARDDHGLGALAVVVRNPRRGAEPVRRELPPPRDEPREQAGTTRLALTSLEVRPGDRLVVTVEARDNDTVSGPKAGLGPNRLIKIFSAAEHHDELMARQQEVMRKMVVQLADEMETPLALPGDRVDLAVDAEAERWLAQARRGLALGDVLQTLANELSDDDLAPQEVARALRNMRADLGKSYEELVTLATEMSNQVRQVGRFPEPYAQRSRRLGHAAAGKLETHILYLEDLVGRQRLLEAEAAARELARTQARLRDLLEQYRKAGDDETRRKILEEINALREQLRDLTRRLAEMQRDVPQDYVNREAMEQGDMDRPMDEIDRLLKEGDIEGAAKALERMAQQTRELLDRMQKGEEEYGGEEFAELREKLQNFARDMDEVTSQQEGLLQDNRARLDRVRERARAALGEDVEQLAARLQKEAAALAEALKGMGTAGLQDLESEQRAEAEARAAETEKALSARDFEEAQRASRQTSAALEWLRTSLADRTEGRFASPSREARKARGRVEEQLLPQARKIQDALEKLMPDPAAHLSDPDREGLRDNARRQGRLAEKARQLAQEMDSIDKELPLFGPEHKDMLDGARRDMQGAQADLGAQDLPGGTGRQRDAVGKMQALRKALSEMGKGGGGGGGGGIPLPFGESGEGGGREGPRGRDNASDKVEIPGAEQFKVPQQFRKDILDAMKEAPPPRFQGEVRQYYEELVK